MLTVWSIGSLAVGVVLTVWTIGSLAVWVGVVIMGWTMEEDTIGDVLGPCIADVCVWLAFTKRVSRLSSRPKKRSSDDGVEGSCVGVVCSCIGEECSMSLNRSCGVWGLLCMLLSMSWSYCVVLVDTMRLCD